MAEFIPPQSYCITTTFFGVRILEIIRREGLLDDRSFKWVLHLAKRLTLFSKKERKRETLVNQALLSIHPEYQKDLFRYLVRLENRQDGKYTSKDVLTVLIKLRKSVDEFGAVVKNLRITERALEFDLYVPDESSKERSLEKLSRDFGNILNEKEITQERGAQKEPTLFQSKEETIKLGVELFNEQRFWECHETIEEIWSGEGSATRLHTCGLCPRAPSTKRRQCLLGDDSKGSCEIRILGRAFILLFKRKSSEA